MKKLTNREKYTLRQITIIFIGMLPVVAVCVTLNEVVFKGIYGWESTAFPLMLVGSLILLYYTTATFRHLRNYVERLRNREDTTRN